MAGDEGRRAREPEVLHAAAAPNDASRMEALAGIWTPQVLKSSCEWPQGRLAVEVGRQLKPARQLVFEAFRVGRAARRQVAQRPAAGHQRAPPDRRGLAAVEGD